ncbi:MAG: ABC transporter permease subunit [Bradyrhizobiaceae bacterium]|nr:ABC transporter permease subunit [Bradyrhizobiaceae bacterium]
MIMRLMKYVLQDVIRGKWLLFYMLFFLLVTEGMLFFTAGEARTVVGLMNVVLLLIPLASVVFGALHLHNGRDFIELMLSQPVNRKSVYIAMYVGVVLAFLGAFVVGVGIPAAIHGMITSNSVLTLIGTGCLLTMCFFAISFWVAVSFNDRVTGLGVAFALWLLLAIIYDGIVLAITVMFADYPLELATIIMVVLNPIDLARIIVMLTFDYAALMGYTGAVFREFFGSSMGVTVSVASLLLWIAVPFWLGMRKFDKKDW